MTRKLTPAQLDEIEAAAKEATPGPWRWKKPGIDYYEVLNVHTTVAVDMVKQADAAHIAMMNPATTLALVAEVRELRAKVERVRALHEPYGCSEPGCIDGCAECESEYGWPCDTIKALGEEA